MAGLVNLISELHKTKSKAKLQASSEKLDFKSAISPLFCKTDVRSISNPKVGKPSSNQSYRSDICLEDEEKLERSRYVLEQKTILYDKLKGGNDVKDKDNLSERFLVNFEDKPSDHQYVEDRKNILAQKWEKIEDDSRQKKDLHYQDVLFDEARSHGVAFMNFSRDETEREIQHDLLKKLRSETKAASAFNAEESKRKKKVMDERLKKVRDRKRLKLGFPIIEPEDDPLKTPPLSDEEDGDSNLKVTEPFVVSQNMEKNFTDGIATNIRKIREWDLGKPNVDRVMSQEEWTESRRQMREKEFAPPKLYSDRIENEDTYKNKRGLLNRLKTPFVKREDEVRHSPYNRNHQTSIHNRLNYNADSNTSKTNEYPEPGEISYPNKARENITKSSWDRSNTWTRNKETEFPKIWDKSPSTECDSSVQKENLERFDRTMSNESCPEAEKAFSQNMKPRLNTALGMPKQAEYGKAVGDHNQKPNSMFERVWDPSNREIEFDKSCLPKKNSEIFKPDKKMDSDANIYLNKNYQFDGANNASSKSSIEPDNKYVNRNSDTKSYGPTASKGWSKWNQGSSLKTDQPYDANVDSKWDGRNAMFESGSGPTSLMNIPSYYDEAWASNKTTVFKDNKKWNATENSKFDHTRADNCMSHGSSEFKGGWGPNIGGYNESSNLAKSSSQYHSASEPSNSKEQRKTTEFPEPYQNKVLNKSLSLNRKSRFDQVYSPSLTTEENSELGLNKNAENLESFKTATFSETSLKHTEFNLSSQKPDKNTFDHFKNAEDIARCDQNKNKLYGRTWGSNKNMREDYSYDHNSNKKLGGSWGPNLNADYNKYENLDIHSSPNQNTGLDFHKSWTPSRKAELDQTFSRFRNSSGCSDEQRSSNMNQSSFYNKPFIQRNSADFSSPASTSSSRWRKPSQQDSITIEKAISEGLSKLRKEFDNTPV